MEKKKNKKSQKGGAEEQVKEKKKYPTGAEHYELFEEVGHGVSASVRRALCKPFNEIVAIKILDFERDNCDLDNIFREAQTMTLVDHPNVLKSHCSFVSGQYLWVVMPFMAGGSCLHILKAAHPDGFDEVVIATILRDILNGLVYLHHHGHIHRDVKAGNILVDAHGAIKLGDFGVSACLYDSGDRQRVRNTFVGTPCWMAPEVMEQLHGYDFKADIWSFGITAIELAHGHAPFSRYPPMKVLLMTLQSGPPGLTNPSDDRFSNSFRQMVASCLMKDPTRRPSAKKLLKHSFFKQARSNDYIQRKLLEGLPVLGERIKELKRKDEDLLAQRKVPDDQREEMSQNEYKRGVSGWHFDLDFVKAQASLIEEVDDSISDNSQTGSSSSLSALDVSEEQSQVPSLPEIADTEIHGLVQIQSATLPSLESTIHEDNDKLQGQPQSSSNCNAATIPIPHPVDDVVSDVPSRALKSADSDELDEKAKAPVVQQKGRFKVTSENVDIEKVAATPTMQKSNSMQVITPYPQISLPSTVPSPLPTCLPSTCNPPSSNQFGYSLFSLLYTALETNIVQRDSILSLMKHIGVADGGCTSSAIPERAMLEAAYEKEKELLQEIADLNWRLFSTLDEQQHKTTETQDVNTSYTI
ncbi:uncharacterized protein LOC133824023 [Humulus lupulus]|uniref:uncharacterized protein LOC133824023 n=1 Tax=Humulus lupulus TaxID=3486 RepID=UPI002B40692A|nr:uncharacterized protein LOC133824023 [Humulus lupulus]XP_062112867.1 uncharacterized protein LOC133824023 [Humulus lupulus]XP_062112868.1 uncharacterized protein LOC133824023 [Humulus lupulus]